MRLDEMNRNETEAWAWDNLNTGNAAREFEHLAMMYRRLIKDRAKGLEVQCPRAEALGELFNGATPKEIEQFLLRQE